MKNHILELELSKYANQVNLKTEQGYIAVDINQYVYLKENTYVVVEHFSYKT